MNQYGKAAGCPSPAKAYRISVSFSSESKKMLPALLTTTFTMTVYDPLQASGLLLIGWQAVFEAFVLPTWARGQ